MIERFALDYLPEVAKIYSVTRRTVWQLADPCHILLFIKEGCCSVQTDGREYLLHAGDFMLIPENCPYLRRPGDDQLCTMYYAHFHLPLTELTEDAARSELSARKAQADTALLHEEPGVPLPNRLYLMQHCPLPAQREKICALFDEAIAGISGNRLQWPVQAAVLVCHLLLMISEQTLPLLLSSDELTLAEKTPEKLRQAVFFIRQHYSEKISLADLCQFCSVSRQQMIRYFHTFFATTPNAYIMQYKIDKARELLFVSQMSVKEISAELGFDDQCYFSRIFTRRTGESPTAYRTRVINFDEKKHIGGAPPSTPPDASPDVPGLGPAGR